MKEWYSKLKFEYQIAFWSAIVILGLFILCIPFYFFSLMEIPQGIALGGLYAIIVYLFLGLFNSEEVSKKSLISTIVILILKFFLMALLLVLVGWLYYSKNIKVFNIFAVTGGYFTPLIIHLILSRKEKSRGYSSEL